jgi:hypothetical protein
MLIRGIAHARKQESAVVFLDFQQLEDDCFANLDVFLRFFATELVAELDLDPDAVERAWRGSRTAVKKMTAFMEKYILPQSETRIILAMDEADRLLHTEFHSNFFGMIRSWQNACALNDLWEKLDILMVISTEPHMLVSDVHQSPFNVGVKIRLHDFDAAQVQALDVCYRQPLAEHDLPALMELLNGHPYLTSKALYTLVTGQLSWAELAQQATVEKRSPFGDHLRYYLWLLRDKPQLRAGLQQVIQQHACPDEVVYDRLLQAGLVRDKVQNVCRCRCRLYEEYFRQRL